MNSLNNDYFHLRIMFILKLISSGAYLLPEDSMASLCKRARKSMNETKRISLSLQATPHAMSGSWDTYGVPAPRAPHNSPPSGRGKSEQFSKIYCHYHWVARYPISKNSDIDTILYRLRACGKLVNELL